MLETITRARPDKKRDQPLRPGRVVGFVVVVAYLSLASPALALLAVLAGLAAVAATAAPRAALVVGPIFIALMPTYWFPNLPGSRTPISPAIVTCLILLPAALRLRREVELLFIDRVVVLFILTQAVGFLVNADQGQAGSIVSVILGIGLPYATFRLLGMHAGNRASAAIGLVAGGIVSSIIAIREYDYIPNPFFGCCPKGSQYALWARADARFGRFRPEAAFGHSIALGMFLVLAIVLALGLAWSARHRGRGRYWPIIAAAIMLFALNRTLVRGPIVMLIVASLVFVMGESFGGRAKRAVLVLLTAAVLVSVLPLTQLDYLREATFGTGRVRDSGDYRFQIFDVMKDPTNFSLLGHPVDTGELGFNNAVGLKVGLKSFDNAYAKIYFSFGIFALLLFLLAVLFVTRVTILAKLLAIDRAWAAALAGCALNLFAVDLLTQFFSFFWISLAIVASIYQVNRPVKPALTN